VLNDSAEQAIDPGPAFKQRDQNRVALAVRLRAAMWICGGTLTLMLGVSVSAEQAGEAPENMANLSPGSELLAPQAEPDCGFKTDDPNATERQQLDYERQCYRHAEMIVRNRLQMLQDAIKQRAAVGSSRTTAAPTDNPTAPAKDIESAQRLVDLGDRHIAQGNIAIAREYYIRAAELGLAVAAMKMAETQDPNELARWNVRGIKPDLVEAKRWYQRALELKASEAEARLRRLGDH